MAPRLSLPFGWDALRVFTRTSRLSFRGAPKARARNPYVRATSMDSGFAASQRPGMTDEGAAFAKSSGDAHMQIAVPVGAGDAARRDDDALAGKLDDGRAVHARAARREGGAVDRGRDRPR